MNIQSPVATTPFEHQAAYFKALAHPIRLQILATMRLGEACVCHLEALLGKRQAYISQQIGVLKQAGLLSERRDGTYIYYSLADPALETILDISRHVVDEQKSTADRIDLSDKLIPAGDCPCPKCATAA